VENYYYLTIYKGKGCTNEPEHYRGISLLSVLGMIFLVILSGRLRDWLVNHEVLSIFQTGFVRGKRTLENVFIIKTIAEKYFREERGRIYWCFVNFEKAFGSINREALWFKMRIGVSENIVNCIRIIYEGTKFCVKCGENEVTTFAPQTREVTQECSLCPYLINIFINDIMEYINVDNSYAPSIGRTTIPGLLFADDLAVSSFTSNGLQKEINQIVRYCKECNLKCNLSKSKIAVRI
jgi:transcription elongation factor Elf1